VSAWKTGDKVRLKAADADGWRQPFKRFALAGRVGTLTVATGPTVSRFSIRFEPIRKGGRTEDLNTFDDRYFEIAPIPIPSSREETVDG
jgi:hypothetical protein